MKKMRISPVYIALIIFIGYFLIEIAITSYYYFSARATLKNLEREIANTEQEIKDLQEKINYMKTEDFIEKYARENFILAKEGETVILFKENEKPQEQQTSQEQTGIIKKIYEKLLKLFRK